MKIIPKYHFTEVKEGNETVFTYKRTPFSYQMANTKILLPLLIPAVFFTAVIAIALNLGLLGAFIFGMLLLYAHGLLCTFIINYFRTLKRYEFRIGGREIKVRGKTYDRAHIHSISQESYYYIDKKVLIWMK